MKYKYIIGLIGFDIVKLSGFLIPSENLDELLMRFKNVNYNSVHVTNNILRITGSGYVFECGRTYRSPYYITLEIHAGTAEGNNLCNMRVEEVKLKVQQAKQELHTIYGIDIQYDMQKLVITCCELNITFPTEKKFVAYKRSIWLLVDAFAKTNSKKYTSGEYKKEGFKEESLMCKRATYTLRVYNKGTELQKKLLNVDFEENLIRVEIRYNKREAVLTNFGTLYLGEITDDIVINSFKEKIKDYKRNIENYLKNKLELKRGYDGKETTVVNIMVKYFNNEEWYFDKVLAALCGYELDYGTPCILDIRDMRMAIHNLQLSGILFPFDEELMMRIYMQACDSMIEVSSLFKDQWELFNEFFNKVLGCETEVTMYH